MAMLLLTVTRAELLDAWQKAIPAEAPNRCLLYTSDAADERSSVDLGGRRIIKKKIYTVDSVRVTYYLETSCTSP